MYNIYRKTNLAKNLKKMQDTFPKAYNFFPESWILPLEKNEFFKQFKKFERRVDPSWKTCGHSGVVSVRKGTLGLISQKRRKARTKSSSSSRTPPPKARESTSSPLLKT